MLMQRYFDALQGQIQAIRDDQANLQKAAVMCAESLANGGLIHIFDSGHLISHELLYRAGGPVAISRLGFSLQVENSAYARAAGENAPTLSYGYIKHIFETSQLRPGDVLFVGSVSGKTPNVVELALQAREHGLKVITLSAHSYSSKLDPEHPSGKRLLETGDLNLDNHAPYGDAMLEVEGVDYPICPASGINAAAVMWAIVAGMVEEMLARGLKPSIFPSVNRPNGRQLIHDMEVEAKRKGY